MSVQSGSRALPPPVEKDLASFKMPWIGSCDRYRAKSWRGGLGGTEGGLQSGAGPLENSGARNNGTKPRYRGKILIFVAPDHGALARRRDCVRVAWLELHVEDVAAMRLVLDNLQAEQAKKELAKGGGRRFATCRSGML
jgi:hypothetical protein